MISGMTGFGAVDFSTPQVKGMIEVKTVNHRYLDVAYYLPNGFSQLEERIQKTLSKEISRGRVTVSIRITQRPTQAISLNQDAVKQYVGYAKQLQKKYGITNHLSVGDLIKLPGVVEVKEVTVDPHQLWPVIEKSLRAAIKGVVLMRRREGKAVSADIANNLMNMTQQITLIKSRSKFILSEKKKQLSNEEFSSFSKSIDVGEELARLAHYVAEAKGLTRGTNAIGKKLDFIAQEMQRETNTIGSKVQEQQVSNAVISLKSRIEKIREQSQNLE